MTKRNPIKQPATELSELDLKMQQADPIIKEAFAQYQKEIARLQKQLVKEQIAHESDTYKIRTEHDEEMKKHIANNIKIEFVSPKHNAPPES